MKTCSNVFIALLLAFSIKGHAGSVGGFGGSTEFTQILNNVELGISNGSLMQQYNEMLNQTAEQIRMVQHQLNTYRNLVTNTTGIDHHIWGDAIGELNKLGELVNKGRGISYSMGAIDEVFRGQYGDYSYSADDLSAQSYSERYREWNQINADTIRNTLEAANLQSEQFQTEDQVMQQLQQMSQTSTGRMQALQVGNQIAGQQVRQMQKLRQLSLLQIQQQSAYLATKNEKEAYEKAQADQYFLAPPGVNIGNEGRY